MNAQFDNARALTKFITQNSKLTAAFALLFSSFCIAAQPDGGGQTATTEDKSVYTLFNPTPPNLMRPFDTDRPSKTDVPFTVDAGHFQIESDFANFTHGDSGGIRTETLELGSTMNLKLGLLNNLEFQTIFGNYVRVDESGPKGATHYTREGYGDITPRLKLNLFGDDGGKYALALLPYVKIPSDTDGAGNHRWEGGFDVPFAWTLPNNFTLNAESGVGCFSDSASHGYHAAVNNSVALYHPLYKALSIYGEFYSSVNAFAAGQWLGSADFGLIYQLTPNISLDADTYIGLTSAAPEYVVFGGFAVRF